MHSIHVQAAPTGQEAAGPAAEQSGRALSVAAAPAAAASVPKTRTVAAVAGPSATSTTLDDGDAAPSFHVEEGQGNIG
jgi:hypothetical protein